MSIASIQPSSRDAVAARGALPQVRGYLRRHSGSPAQINVVVEETQEELVLPRAAVELLATILAHMAAGRIWTGPAAQHFGQELTGQRQVLLSACAETVNELRALLARTPADSPG